MPVCDVELNVKLKGFGYVEYVTEEEHKQAVANYIAGILQTALVTIREGDVTVTVNNNTL